MKNGSSSRLGIILGVVFIVMALALFIHDASYIILGNTVDLNQILKDGGELPRDKYVTYTCSAPLGGYAETRSTISGIIPLPGTSESHAFLAENGTIMTIETSKKSLKSELAKQSDNLYAGVEVKPVTVEGCLQVNSGDVDRLLESYFSGFEYEGDGVELTYFVIDTTKTRLKITLMYVAFMALGAFLLIFGIKQKRKGM